MGVSGSKSDFLMDGFCDKKYETVKGQLFLELVVTTVAKYNDIIIIGVVFFPKKKMSNHFQLNIFFVIVIILFCDTND